MKYIRFGEFPKNNKSINWTTLSSEKKRDIFDAIDFYGYDSAIEELSDENFEAGISAWRLVDGFPEITNLCGLRTLAMLVKNMVNDHKKVYVFEADEVGTGIDGEPLVDNIRDAKEINVVAEIVHKFIFDMLAKNYAEVKGVFNPEKADEVLSFCDWRTNREYKSFAGADFFDCITEGFEKNYD